jgi:hypothetical protein
LSQLLQQVLYSVLGALRCRANIYINTTELAGSSLPLAVALSHCQCITASGTASGRDWAADMVSFAWEIFIDPPLAPVLFLS